MAYPAASRIFPNEAIKVALAESITSGAFTDTGYMLYSRRLANGGAGAPRRVYACSAVLKAAEEYFSAQLDGGFSTNETLPDKIESYGYESDSDLDDTEDLEPSAEFEHEGELAQNALTVHRDNTISSRSEAEDVRCKYNVVVHDVAASTW